MKLRNRKKPVIVTRRDGTEHEYETGAAAARAEGIHVMTVSNLANGKSKEYFGIKVRFKNPEDLSNGNEELLA